MTPDHVAENVVVSMQYRLSLDDGSMVEESTADDPLVYLHGHQNVIVGLEQALEGRVEDAGELLDEGRHLSLVHRLGDGHRVGEQQPDRGARDQDRQHRDGAEKAGAQTGQAHGR